MSKTIILELIPTSLNPETGDIIQISALKIDELKIEERFDVRLKEEKIGIPDLVEMISYDKSEFKYLESTDEILKSFKEFCEDLDLIIIDNKYTSRYLEGLDNKLIPFHKLVDMDNSDTIIDDLMIKFKLVPTEHIVDLMFEALMFKDEKK